MPLLLPKSVEIQNLKLRLFYYAIQVVAFAVVFGRFVITEQWAKPLLVADYMAADLWANPASPESLRAAFRIMNATDICTNPRIADFLWDPGGEWAYLDHQCLPLCEPALDTGQPVVIPCIRAVDSVRSDPQGTLFFVTQFEEHAVDVPAGGSDYRLNAFVPLEDAQSFSFVYHYSVPKPSIWGHYMEGGIITTDHPVINGSSTNVLTVVMDSKGGIERVVESGQPSIDMTVREALNLAGIPEFLDRPNPGAGPNYISGPNRPDHDGGFGRITGLNLIIEVQCFQHADSSVPLDGFPTQDWPGPTCYVTVKRSSHKQWASSIHVLEREDEQSGHRISVQRSEHGVRVGVVLKGRFSFLNIEHLILQITSSIVFLFLPEKLIFLFVVYMLGHLSTIYRDALIEKFDVGKEIARISARILSGSISFVELEDLSKAMDSDRAHQSTQSMTPATGDDLSGIISKERLDSQMREVLRNRSAMLQEDEMRSLVQFCHDALLATNNLWESKSLCDDVRELMMMCLGRGGGGSPRSTSNCFAMGVGDINIDIYSMAYASSPALEFNSFVKMFDTNRRIGRLEHFFCPGYLKGLGEISDDQSDGQETRSSRPSSQQARLSELKIDPNSPNAVVKSIRKSHTEELRDKKALLVGSVEHISKFDAHTASLTDRLSKIEHELDGFNGQIHQRVDAVVSDLWERLQSMERSMHDRINALMGDDMVGTPATSAGGDGAAGPALEKSENQRRPQMKPAEQLREAASRSLMLDPPTGQAPSTSGSELHSARSMPDPSRVHGLRSSSATSSCSSLSVDDARGLGGGTCPTNSGPDFAMLERFVSELQACPEDNLTGVEILASLERRVQHLEARESGSSHRPHDQSHEDRVGEFQELSSLLPRLAKLEQRHEFLSSQCSDALQEALGVLKLGGWGATPRRPPGSGVQLSARASAGFPFGHGGAVLAAEDRPRSSRGRERDSSAGALPKRAGDGAGEGEGVRFEARRRRRRQRPPGSARAGASKTQRASDEPDSTTL